MTNGLHIYAQFLRDRRRSTISWSLGLAAIVGATAAFYPAVEDALTGAASDNAAMASLFGLGEGIDPSSPLGFIWSNLYANIVPWVLMALGISASATAIAGDEEAGTLEYLLSKPVTRRQIALARFGGVVTILVIASIAAGLTLVVTAPMFDLTTDRVTTAADGTTITDPGVAFGNVVDGTISAWAVGLGAAAIAYLLSSTTGRRGLTVGVSSGFVIAGYVVYTLSNITGSLEALTWLAPWRWYVADAMFIDGLSAEVLLPLVSTVIAVAIGTLVFERRDLV